MLLGKWMFRNGNVLEGQYVQQTIANEDDQGQDGQPNIKLEWVSTGNIYAAAAEINALENL
jgi:hypothetical protein